MGNIAKYIGEVLVWAIPLAIGWFLRELKDKDIVTENEQLKRQIDKMGKEIQELMTRNDELRQTIEQLTKKHPTHPKKEKKEHSEN